MPRVKRGVTAHRKHKKILGLAKGFQNGRSKRITEAKSATLHAGQYAFAGRKQRRRDMRKLWITQMGIALNQQGLSYSKFIASLKAKNILLNRKSLAELAVTNMKAFKEVVGKVAQ
jgi:large subunit ribosomal protein L20